MSGETLSASIGRTGSADCGRAQAKATWVCRKPFPFKQGLITSLRSTSPLDGYNIAVIKSLVYRKKTSTTNFGGQNPHSITAGQPSSSVCCWLQSDEEREFAKYSSAYTLPLSVLRAVPHPLAVEI